MSGSARPSPKKHTHEPAVEPVFSGAAHGSPLLRGVGPAVSGGEYADDRPRGSQPTRDRRVAWAEFGRKNPNTRRGYTHRAVVALFAMCFRSAAPHATRGKWNRQLPAIAAHLRNQGCGGDGRLAHSSLAGDSRAGPTQDREAHLGSQRPQDTPGRFGFC